MSISTAHPQIFNALPKQVQGAIAAYATEAEVSIDAVIILAIAQFLELESVPVSNSHSRTDNSILNELPASLQNEIRSYAAEDDMPPEFVVELAIAHFLDPDSVTFADCFTQLQRDRVELLRQHKRDQQTMNARNLNIGE